MRSIEERYKDPTKTPASRGFLLGSSGKKAQRSQSLFDSGFPA